MSKESTSIPKVINRQTLGGLFLITQMVLAANGANQASNPQEPDPLDLLKTVTQARRQIVSGEMEFEVARYIFGRPLDGTNHIQINALFDGEHRRFEQFGRRYSYVMMGPDAGPVTDAKRRELGLDKEAAVQAGLLTGYEEHHVTAYDGTALLSYSEEGRRTDIMDPSTGNFADYVFDPRILGLTSVVDPTSTIENCLAFDAAKSVKLAGQETVAGIAAWHVRVLDKWDMNRDFWMDATQPSHVVKCEYNGDTVISKFDAKHPNDPIPIDVLMVKFPGVEAGEWNFVLFAATRASTCGWTRHRGRWRG